MTQRSGIVLGRRLAAGVAVVAVLVATSVTMPSASATVAPTVTTIVKKNVPRSGNYVVVVVVAPPAAPQSVSVFVGSQAQRSLAIFPGHGAALAFSLHLRSKGSPYER